MEMTVKAMPNLVPVFVMSLLRFAMHVGNIPCQLAANMPVKTVNV